MGNTSGLSCRVNYTIIQWHSQDVPGTDIWPGGGAQGVSAMKEFTAYFSQGCLSVKGPPSAEVYVATC